MANAYLSPVGNEQQNDANGAPLSGGKIFTYAAGTTTPIATYQDNAQSALQANPIILNSSGLPANPIWLPAGQAVKMVFTDANGVTSRPTVDNITGINDPAGALFDQWVIYPSSPTYISATSFSVAGDQRNIFQVGRRVRTVNTGGTKYGYITGVAFSTVTTVTVANDSGSLDSGLSQVSYGLVSATSTSLPGLSGSDGTLSFRNRLHNGNFAINQRGLASGVLAAGAYAFDRWKAGAGGATISSAGGGADTVITITAGTLVQVVESGNIEGGVYTLVNRGTAQARIAVNGAATSGAYATASTAAPLQSASATSGQAVTVEFTTGTIDRAQLEPGVTATTFERRPLSVELALCQRYFQFVGAGCTGGWTGATQAQIAIIHRVPMRVAPTAVLSTTTPIIGDPGVANYTGSGSTLSAAFVATTTGGAYNINGFASGVQGRAAVMNGDYIQLSADL